MVKNTGMLKRTGVMKKTGRLKGTTMLKRTGYIVIAALLTLMALTALAGCGANGSTSGGTAATTAAATEATAEITTAEASAATTQAASTQEAASTEVETTAAPATVSGGQLNLFTWEGMFPQEILDGFEAETGIRINYADFDYDETMLSKLEAAGGGDYDLVIADDYIIETAIAAGLVQKLDFAKLQNGGNINPIYTSQFYDPNNEYTVPYGAGVQTIVYDPSALDLDVKGYADLWNPALVNNLGVIGNYRVIDGMALKVLGESYNTDNLDAIQAAGDKLIELAPNIRLIKDDQIEEDLLSGEISAAVMYTSQVNLAVLTNPELRIVFPQEGIGFGVMAGFIPSKAPNADAAYAFLDYILDAARGAQCFEYLGYYSTNQAADALISAEMKPLLTLPEGFNTNMEMIQNIGAEADEKHSVIWTAFKTAAGQQ